MGYSLVEFCHEVREILREHDDRDGREQVRRKLEALLRDPDFCATYVGPGNDAGMEQIYQDPELHFCVLACNMTEPRTSPPHDHGESWAVYGQAAGHTDMTVWSATGDAGGIEPVRTFRLEAGQAGLFDVREIHSIDYTEGARFVRVTGVDMTGEERRVFDPMIAKAPGPMRSPRCDPHEVESPALCHYIPGMATEHAVAAATSEKELRERIHRLFCGDVPGGPPSASPSFWVGPTDEQKSTVSMDVEEYIVLRDDFEVRVDPSAQTADPRSVEKRWLETPHVDLDGRSPEAMLSGGEPARRRLCAFVAAIEAAVRQGSFS